MIEDYSDGKISVELVWSYGIAGVTESDEALLDGRIDVHTFANFASPSEFPINGELMLKASTFRDSALVTGTLSTLGAVNEASWKVAGVTDEWSDKGLAPIMPLTSSEISILACSEPTTTLADLKGKLIRTGTLGQVGQVEALGGTAVNLPYTELYEGLQRGIIDCVITGPGLVKDAGMLAVAPHIMTPIGASFETLTVSELAGLNWETWPLPVRQLLFDSLNELALGNVVTSYDGMPGVVEEMTAEGGEFHQFDDEVNETLKAYNDKTLASIAESEYLDGGAFVSTLSEEYETWSRLVEEAGYSTDTLVDFESADAAEPLDLAPFLELYRERVLEPNRPR